MSTPQDPPYPNPVPFPFPYPPKEPEPKFPEPDPDPEKDPPAVAGSCTRTGPDVVDPGMEPLPA